MDIELEVIKERFHKQMDDVIQYRDIILEKCEIITWKKIKSILSIYDEIRSLAHDKSDNAALEISNMREILSLLRGKLTDIKECIELYHSIAKSNDNIEYNNDMEKMITQLLAFNIEQLESFKDKNDLFNVDIKEVDVLEKTIIIEKKNFEDIIRQEQANYAGKDLVSYYASTLLGCEVKQKGLIENLCKEIRVERAIDIVEMYKEILDLISSMEKTYMILNDISVINLDKQSFILIMANFDAVLFDITKEFLGKHFFECIGRFGEFKIDQKSISKYSNYEELRESIIVDVLESKYAKNLVTIFNDINQEMLSKEEYKKVKELFERRNVHLHNNGVVDKKYKVGKGLYGLRDGDEATINEYYFIEASIIIHSYIEKMLNWVSGAISGDDDSPD